MGRMLSEERGTESRRDWILYAGVDGIVRVVDCAGNRDSNGGGRMIELDGSSCDDDEDGGSTHILMGLSRRVAGRYVLDLMCVLARLTR